MPDVSAPPTSPAPPTSSRYRRLYEKMEALASTRYALAAMLAVSVVDGSVFPVPPFALLVPMVLAKPKSWLKLAVLGTVFSIGGGFIGYFLGGLAHEGAMSWLQVDLNMPVRRFGLDTTLGALLGQNFWFLALLCSVLPTPFKVVAIASGMVQVPLEQFFLASLLGRTVRFFVVAGALRAFGEPALRWLRLDKPRGQPGSQPAA